jgi:gas vesicle protein
MAKKANQTASFMVRFNQKIFEEEGESKVQWRGKVSHVQGGDEQNFSDFQDALSFMQKKLAELTKEATKDKTTAQQEGILKKSLYMWKTIAQAGPKVLMDTLKDPKKQITQIQGQIQDQISHFGDEIGEKVQIDQWRNASKSDFKKVKKSIGNLADEIKKLNAKIDSVLKKD